MPSFGKSLPNKLLSFFHIFKSHAARACCIHRKIDEKIGQGPYEFPTVFSFFLPEFVPDSGSALTANLVSPESAVADTPNIIAILNGMFSLVKYGLGDCNNGFSTYPGYSSCRDNGQFSRSYGHLFYNATGASDFETVANLALLLTAGRLSDDKLNKIAEACSLAEVSPSIPLVNLGGNPYFSYPLS